MWKNDYKKLCTNTHDDAKSRKMFEVSELFKNGHNFW